MESKVSELCFNCKYRAYNSDSGITECLIPKEQKNCYFAHWKQHYNDVDGCPFKELEDGCEYAYWN